MLELSGHTCFGGEQLRFQHRSRVLDCSMRFSVYLPPQAQAGEVPALLWLSGFTCSDENFVHKAGAQQFAAKHGIALVIPDTSPRGEQIHKGDEPTWHLGEGASFYLNATVEPWAANYQMASYICDELPGLIADLPVDNSCFGIAGHGMGGHGAIVLGLSYPQLFRSISAFAPICNPAKTPWGETAFRHYLGADKARWQHHDSCWLVANGACRTPLLVDQGSDDHFLEDELKPERLQAACAEAGHPLNYQLHPGYDHSYFFVASFIESHIAYHAGILT
ncbi:S-formylglutathione hydrolase [Teredinibacter turnerae T7901]|uniref:S-formylglutathione hydrolase n=1 Tax=Teredinibacter turnerae (strain ATCC 39867 / T7901) TaxID=377629 RepID=C5BIF5_TERTT|nr:S-formylglutathione hydrolase [Teredinibacter turnerae]ACR12513.1 S-formylglutathione hydrolase [Teredinibacter turnerae T7901]